jgi:hypothetical protein
VRSYGAVADGMQDDTAAIQAAVDSCHAAGGGVVYLPAGRYLCASEHYVHSDLGGAVQLRDGVYLQGDGPGQTVLVGHGPNNSTVVASQARGIGVGNLTISADGTTENADGIKLYTCRNIHVYNVTVSDYFIGIALYSCRDAVVATCLASATTGAGIAAGESYMPLEMDGAIQSTDNVIIEDCTVMDAVSNCGFRIKGYAPGYAPVARRCGGVAIRQCDAFGNAGGGVFVTYAQDVTLDAISCQDNGENIMLAGVQGARLTQCVCTGTGGATPIVVTPSNYDGLYAAYGASSDVWIDGAQVA